jgi:hypothetical protein
MKVHWKLAVTLMMVCAFVLTMGTVQAAKSGKKDKEASMPVTPSGNWSMEKILSMDRAQFLEIWKKLPAADMREMNGHYQGLVPNAGHAKQQKDTTDYMYNQDSTRGYWLGKAYKAHSDTKGEGYNRWRFEGGKVVRNGRFGTEMGKSLIDGKPALLMYYSAFNKNTTLVDEIRKLDEYVYVGVGTSDLGDGKRSNAEGGVFVLLGPTDEWVGVDEGSDSK